MNFAKTLLDFAEILPEFLKFHGNPTSEIQIKIKIN